MVLFFWVAAVLDQPPICFDTPAFLVETSWVYGEVFTENAEIDLGSENNLKTNHSCLNNKRPRDSKWHFDPSVGGHLTF